MSPFLNRSQKILKDTIAFAKVERFIAVLLISLPIILRWYDYTESGFRPSISNYVYMCDSYVFGALISLAAALFIFNGALYFEGSHGSKKGRWYNIFLGVFLFGVLFFPHLQFSTIHYIFAGLFYAGAAAIMPIYCVPEKRVFAYLLATITLGSVALYFILKLFPEVSFTKNYTLLIAEWIGLTAIAIHFVLRSFDTDGDWGLEEKDEC